jgi:SpoVK/Ycf46/Vps4 family AAA+-type ATPase
MMTKQTKPEILADQELDAANGGLFSGASGTGKTLSAHLLGKQCASNGNSALTEEIEMVIERLERG